MIRLSHFAFNEKHWAPLSELAFELPTVQAHRGYWVSGAMQNSLESLLAAIQAGYKMAEVDLRLTKDQRVVLFHDAEVFDMDTAIPIHKMTLSELQAMVPVSTLEEVLEATADKLILNLEIKNETRTQFALEEKLIQILKTNSHSKRLLFSSFNPFSLAWMAELQPEIPRALLVTQDPGTQFMLRELLFLGIAKPHFLHARWEDLDHYRDIPRERKVIWTLNDLQFAKTIQAGKRVASIITDHILPEAL